MEASPCTPGTRHDRELAGCRGASSRLPDWQWTHRRYVCRAGNVQTAGGARLRLVCQATVIPSFAEHRTGACRSILMSNLNEWCICMRFNPYTMCRSYLSRNYPETVSGGGRNTILTDFQRRSSQLVKKHPKCCRSVGCTPRHELGARRISMHPNKQHMRPTVGGSSTESARKSYLLRIFPPCCSDIDNL